MPLQLQSSYLETNYNGDLCCLGDEHGAAAGPRAGGGIDYTTDDLALEKSMRKLYKRWCA